MSVALGKEDARVEIRASSAGEGESKHGNETWKHFINPKDGDTGKGCSVHDLFVGTGRLRFEGPLSIKQEKCLADFRVVFIKWFWTKEERNLVTADIVERLRPPPAIPVFKFS